MSPPAMEFEQALAIANAAMHAHLGRYLSDVETAILRGSWDDLTYEQIAESSRYSISYVRRHVGAQFWKLLSQALGEPVSKTNFRTALERRGQEQTPSVNAATVTVASSSNPSASPQVDWGEALDVSVFYGRENELNLLSQWIVRDHCRLIGLLGMGGIGKTALAIKVAQEILQHFDFVIWRSLRNAPPLKTLLTDIIPFLSNQCDTQTKLERLLYWLRNSRCLIILDNVETIMQPGDCAGHYQSNYEEYGDLFQLIGESLHQSCFLITSREKPIEIVTAESMDSSVRSLHLSGSLDAAIALIDAKGLLGSSIAKRKLCTQYNSSPLALKIVSGSIQSLFSGDIAAFLEQDTLIFNGLRRLLDQQFERLSELEKTIMYWLAINREWTSINNLAEDIVPTTPRSRILEALESLIWRCLIETAAAPQRDQNFGTYTQQPVVMEYVTQRLIETIGDELKTGQLDQFIRCAILKTTVKSYVSETQTRLIVMAIAKQFQEHFKSIAALEQQLLRILTALRKSEPMRSGYGAGNFLNLCRHLPTDLSDYDFSYLSIQQANLQNLTLPRVNFAHAQFVNSSFTHTLTSIFAVAFNSDSSHFATGESTGKISLWRSDDAQLLQVFEGHVNRVMGLSFSPNGRLLASASADCTVRLWDVASGRLIAILGDHTNGVCSVSFSSDQLLLASASMDHSVIVWDVQTYQQIQTLKAHTNWVWSVSFCPNCCLLASGGADTLIHLWDARSGQLLNTLTGHSDRVFSVCFSPNSQFLATASEDRTVKLWDVETGQLLKTLEGHSSIVWSVSISADNKWVASGSSDQTVRVWNVETGQLFKTFNGASRIWSVCFSPVAKRLPAGDLNRLVSGSSDCTAKLWDVESGRLIKTIHGYTNGVRSLAFDPGGKMLVSGTAADQVVHVWDINSGQLIKTLHRQGSTIHSVQCFTSPTGEPLLVCASSDHTVTLWNLHTGQLVRTLRGHTDTIWSVSVNPQGTLCASAGSDYTIRLWDVETGMLLNTLQEHEGWVWTVYFSPDGRYIASGSGDSTIRLWDVETGTILNTLHGHTAWVRSVAFSPDGKLIASGSVDCTVKLWNVISGELINTLQNHSSWVWEVSFSPDGFRLASSSTDRTVNLWDLQSGQLLKTLHGHTGEVLSVRFSPDGNCLASGSADETVRIWDSDTGLCLRVLRGDRPYEGMNITGVTGISEAQKAALKSLGAIEHS